MSDSLCQPINSLVLLSALCFLAVFLSQQPYVEIAVLWMFVGSATLAHLHYGIVVVSLLFYIFIRVTMWG